MALSSDALINPGPRSVTNRRRFANVEPPRFEYGVLCGAPTAPQVRGGRPLPHRANGRFISFLLAI